ncbi:hepatic triacylglycerol lipase [Chanos chanos]|uniref:Hepatic triacylglycerol lipase n=1 Tax=Chanos chanos TaxID=29144 RepID=A0A6J2VHH5_CHACN|nr:hepatic triacylglycerol lipase-like [Chanos chanos]
MRVLLMLLTFTLFFHSFTAVVKMKGNRTDDTMGAQQSNHMPFVVKSSFHMYFEGSSLEDTCTIQPFQSDTLSACSFNRTSPLVIIIHGWSVSGLMEDWVFKLASAFKRRLRHVNVIINDWRPLARRPYPIATKNSKQVGRDVANLLEWLKENSQLRMDKVHLIGYSLGAHVAGFAGNYIKGPGKLGRITGLDPAGPQFEGAPPSERLSPDDAKFVDAIHTFAKSNIGLGVGIKQTVGHIDFYPNGGSPQPGCQMMEMYSNLYQYGLQGFPKTIKCSHERSAQLFTDSLLYKDRQCRAYRCRDDNAFDKGLCVDCKKNRCNMLGYDVRKTYRGSSKGLYLKTRSQTPYKVYHYQIRVLLSNLIEPVEASISILLTGTKGASQDLPVTLFHEHAGNKSYTSLVTVDSDLGNLTGLKLRWEGEAVWSSWWRRMTNIMSFSGSRQDTELGVQRIRLRAGETQEKTWFCAPSGDVIHLKPSQEGIFVRCEEGPQSSKARMKSTTHTPPSNI